MLTDNHTDICFAYYADRQIMNQRIIFQKVENFVSKIHRSTQMIPKYCPKNNQKTQSANNLVCCSEHSQVICLYPIYLFYSFPCLSTLFECWFLVFYRSCGSRHPQRYFTAHLSNRGFEVLWTVQNLSETTIQSNK